MEEIKRKRGRPPKTAKENSEDFHKGNLRRLDLTDIPEAIEKYAKTRDLVLRWLDSERVKKFGNYDERGYRIFKVPETVKKEMGEEEVEYSLGTDSTVRRESMILAAAPRHKIEAYNNYFKAENRLTEDIISNRISQKDPNLVAEQVSVERKKFGVTKDVSTEDIFGD